MIISKQLISCSTTRCVLFFYLLFVYFLNPNLAFADDSVTFTLTDALKRAIDTNPKLKATREDLAYAKGGKLTAYRAVLPTIQGLAGYQHTYDKNDLFLENPITGQTQAISIGKKNAYLFRLEATQPIFDFGGMIEALKQGGLAVKANEAALEDAKNELIYNTTLAYYRVALLKEKQRLAEKDLAQTKRKKNAAQVKRDQSLGTDTDLLQADALLAAKETLLLRAKQERDQGESTLLTLLALPRNTAITLSDTPKIDTHTLDETTVFETALQQNPFLKQLSLSRDALGASLRLQKKKWFPRIDGRAQYGTQAETDESFPQNSEFVESLNVGAAMSFTFFDGLKREGEIAQAKASWLKSHYTLQNATRQFEDALKKALDDDILARESYRAEQAGLKAARALKTAADARYAAGEQSELDLLSAEIAVTQAETNVLNATWSSIAARAYVLRLMGQNPLKE